jgi:hypothetical protein
MIAHLTDQAGVGDEFENWPLHVTVLPWFFAGEEWAKLELAAAAVELRACDIALGHEERMLGELAVFGSEEKPILVRPIQNSTQLGVIHGVLIRPFLPALEDREWVGGGYNPHMTVRNNPDPGEGHEFRVDSLSLVRYGKPKKKVIETVTLEAHE